MSRSRITAAYLREHRACEKEAAEFARRFPHGLLPASTDAGRRRQARRVAGLDVEWAAERLFAEPALAAYRDASAAAEAAYREARAPALAACRDASAAAEDAYREARAPALAAYTEAEAIAFLRIAAEGGLR
jgi:hypothetical protein